MRNILSERLAARRAYGRLLAQLEQGQRDSQRLRELCEPFYRRFYDIPREPGWRDKWRWVIPPRLASELKELTEQQTEPFAERTLLMLPFRLDNVDEVQLERR